MSGETLASVCGVLVIALPLAWLLGYRRGHDDALGRAVASLRFSALLNNTSGRGFTPSETALAKARHADAWADRLDRRRFASRGDQ